MTRDRGTYGPPEGKPHFVVGWGTDRAVAFAQDRTIGRAAAAVLPAVNLASRAGAAADQLWMGTQLMGGRDEAEKPVAVVGQELFHTVADRVRAIAMLSTGFQALANDLAVWQTANMDSPTATATAQWLFSDVTPTLTEWSAFVEHETNSWWARVATGWSTFTGWWDRLKQLRALARAHGIVLQSVDPIPLPKTIWETGAEGKGSEATALLGVLKIGAATVLTIMGIVGSYTIFRQLHPKHARLNQEAVREVVREELANKQL